MGFNKVLQTSKILLFKFGVKVSFENILKSLAA
jgi:hypothetical protein